MTKEQLEALLADDMDTVLEKVVEAMNQARPGHIIEDSEEPVQEAAGDFRRRLFAKALKLRGQRGASSPSAGRDRPGNSVAQ